MNQQSYKSPVIERMREIYPAASAQSLRQICKMPRADVALMMRGQAWRIYKAVEGNHLGFRAVLLRREGRETLQNVILGLHGRASRY